MKKMSSGTFLRVMEEKIIYTLRTIGKCGIIYFAYCARFFDYLLCVLWRVYGNQEKNIYKNTGVEEDL